MLDECNGFRDIVREADESAFYPILSLNDEAATLFGYVVFSVSATKGLLVFSRRFVLLAMRAIALRHECISLID